MADGSSGAVGVFPKTCGCGRVYEASTWAELKWIGVMSDGEDGYLALRDCVACNSTLSVPLGNDDVSYSPTIPPTLPLLEPVADAVSLSLLLAHAANRVGVPLHTSMRLLDEIVALPNGNGDRIIAERKREHARRVQRADRYGR